MSNELIVIEESTALAAFSEERGLSPFIQQVRDEVNNFEHNLTNGAQRNKTASLAAKVRKIKVRLDNLGKGLTESWAQQKKAVDANRKSMREEMDEIAILARKPLDDWQAEQDKIEAEKAYTAMIEDAYKIDSEFNEWRENQKLMSHMDAININHEFDKQKAIDIEALRLIAEQEEKDRIQYEKDIADAAAKQAREDAERDAQIIIMHVEAIAENSRLDSVKAKQDAEDQRKAAIQADIDLENEREQNRINADNARIESKRLADEAEQLRVSQAKERVRLDAESEQRRIKENADAAALAEKNRLAAIESTKIAEAKKVSDKKLADDQAAATRKANIDYANGIKRSIVRSLMEHAGLSKEDATATAKAIWEGKIANTSVSF